MCPRHQTEPEPSPSSAAPSATLVGEHELDVRKERRFVVAPELGEHIAALASSYLTPEIYQRSRPYAFTRTTYFDTADHALYRSRAPHCRVRLREYACAGSLDESPQLTGIAYLELKATHDDTRSKLRVGIKVPTAARARLRQQTHRRGQVAIRVAAVVPGGPTRHPRAARLLEVPLGHRRSLSGDREPKRLKRLHSLSET